MRASASVSDFQNAPEPHEPQQAESGMTNAGMWALLVMGVVFLLCGCCAVVPNGAEQQTGPDEDLVAMATQWVIQLGLIIGGLVCIGIAVYRFAARAGAPTGHSQGGEPSTSAPTAPAGQGMAWVILIVGIFLVLGSSFLGLGVGVIGGILATDPPDVTGPYVIFGVLAVAVVGGFVLGALAMRYGYRGLRRGAVRQ